jgi:alpha-D-ribose 1-methylphosphonate 5-triphosphate synthase subunit PhnH
VISPLTGGFTDHARQAAKAFRVALDAMASPGRAGVLSGAVPPPGLSVAAGVLALTLTDRETPLWLAPALRDGPVAEWLVFHAGTALTQVVSEAAFALGPWEALLPLEQWPAGLPAYPDRSVTLIVEVAGMTGGPPLTLRGPGIESVTQFAPVLPEGAAAALRANAARFPLGLDLFFTAQDRVSALPRTTVIGG